MLGPSERPGQLLRGRRWGLAVLSLLAGIAGAVAVLYFTGWAAPRRAATPEVPKTVAWEERFGR